MAVERFLELSVRDLDVLDHAEDVGELQAEELDALALGTLQDFFAKVGHSSILGEPWNLEPWNLELLNLGTWELRSKLTSGESWPTLAAVRFGAPPVRGKGDYSHPSVRVVTSNLLPA